MDSVAMIPHADDWPPSRRIAQTHRAVGSGRCRRADPACAIAQAHDDDAQAIRIRDTPRRHHFARTSAP